MEKLYVDKKELAKYKSKKGTIIRFKKGFNAKIDEAGELNANATFISYSKTEHPIISWVKELADVEILMSDGSTKRGFSSKSILDAKGIIHFEGLGYANIEETKNGIVKCVYSYD